MKRVALTWSQSTCPCIDMKNICINQQKSSPCCAILESTLNSVSWKVNLSDIHVGDPLDILLAHDIPVTHWGWSAWLIFNPQSLPDLKWPDIVDKRSHITGQVCKASSNILTSKTSPVSSSDSTCELWVEEGNLCKIGDVSPSKSKEKSTLMFNYAKQAVKSCQQRPFQHFQVTINLDWEWKEKTRTLST